MTNPWRVTVNGDAVVITLVHSQKYTLNGPGKMEEQLGDIIDHEMLSLETALKEAMGVKPQ